MQRAVIKKTPTVNRCIVVALMIFGIEDSGKPIADDDCE